MGIKVTNKIPTYSQVNGQEDSFKKSLKYMDLDAGTSLLGKKINYIFIGSCTNGRIEDLRLVADMVKGKKKAPNVIAMIIPGSKQVEKQAKEEGLDVILKEAGFELRQG